MGTKASDIQLPLLEEHHSEFPEYIILYIFQKGYCIKHINCFKVV